MNFVIFVIYCVVSCAALCSVEANQYPDQFREQNACLVKYLKNKRKLSTDYQSAIPASSKCRNRPFVLKFARSELKDLIAKNIPNAAECLTSKINYREAVDYVVKIMVLQNSESLSDTEKQTQVEATRSQIKEEFERILSDCNTDDKTFIEFFSILGNRNYSLKEIQYEYCLAKYVVDNKVLEFDVEMNPQHIDPASVDCEKIIEADKQEDEKAFNDLNSPKVKEQGGSMDCGVNTYRNMRVYDWFAGLQVVRDIDISEDVKRMEANRMFAKIREFVLTRSICI